MARKAPKSHEDKLLERLRARGFKLYTDQVGAWFAFMVRPTTTVGVDLDGLQAGFEKEVFRRIKDVPFESPLTGVVLLPKIMDPTISTMPDSVTHKRKERSFFVSLNIPFAVWSKAQRAERVDLLAQNLIHSIGRIPVKHLPQSDRQVLTNAIDIVRRTIKARKLN